MSPPSWTPLLRHEGARLATEAAVLTLLARSALPIPELVKYEPRDSLMGPSFLATMYIPGISYAAISPYLTRSAQAGIERQIRSLGDVMRQYTSPTFGPVDEVSGGHTFGSWGEAFTAMIEDVLMDGEDMLVALPSTEIRDLVKRMGSVLGEVKQAKLVVRGLGEEQNVLVEGISNEVIGLVDLSSAFWGDGEWFERIGERGIL